MRIWRSLTWIGFLALAGVLAGGVLVAGVSRLAQVANQAPSTSLGAGVFTDAQATRGARLAEKQCASCHDPRSGGSAPPLSGERFMQKWATPDRTVDDLFYITRTSMPFGAGNSLAPQEYADLVAFMLRENGYAAGPTELRPDPAALARVRLERQAGGSMAAKRSGDRRTV